MSELGDFLKNAREKIRPKLSQQAVADHFRITKAAVSRWESGDAVPDRKKINQLARILGVPADTLRALADENGGAAPPIPSSPAGALSPISRGFGESPPLPASALAPTAQPMQPDDRQRTNPLPVWASAEGGEQGAMLITTGPIDWIPRPRTLQVAGAFAVYLIGDSMSPAYDHGDQLYIHPHRPPEGGLDCLFVQELDDGTLLGLAKRLVRARPDRWRVRQFNPAKDFDLDRRQWRKAWVIVGKMNRG